MLVLLMQQIKARMRSGNGSGSGGRGCACDDVRASMLLELLLAVLYIRGGVRVCGILCMTWRGS
jgi:hypothetical protein